MSAPQPPAEGSPRPDARPGDGGDPASATYDFHGEKLDFDPYRFGAPEPTSPVWSPPPAGPPATDRPPAPGERWAPGADPGSSPPRPGDYWPGGPPPGGVFPPPGYARPEPGRADTPSGDDAGRVDLAKPAAGAAPSAPTYPPPAGHPGPSGYPPAGYPPPAAGAPQHPTPSGYPTSPTRTEPPRTNGVAVGGFVVSLVGCVLFLTSWVAVVLGLVGIGLSIGGTVKARRGGPHKRLASWGLALGVLAVVLGVVVLIVVLRNVDLQCLVDANGDSSRVRACIR